MPSQRTAKKKQKKKSRRKQKHDKIAEAYLGLYEKSHNDNWNDDTTTTTNDDDFTLLPPPQQPFTNTIHVVPSLTSTLVGTDPRIATLVPAASPIAFPTFSAQPSIVATATTAPTPLFDNNNNYNGGNMGTFLTSFNGMVADTTLDVARKTFAQIFLAAFNRKDIDRNTVLAMVRTSDKTFRQLYDKLQELQRTNGTLEQDGELSPSSISALLQQLRARRHSQLPLPPPEEPPLLLGNSSKQKMDAVIMRMRTESTKLLQMFTQNIRLQHTATIGDLSNEKDYNARIVQEFSSLLDQRLQTLLQNIVTSQ